jgi:anaerobic magnesium-protoporphyrin IX monomethyl ester cyclase
MNILPNDMVPIKVLLVIPPSPFLLDEKVFPPLGILRVASSLQKSGHTVKILDLTGCKNYTQKIVICVEEFFPDVIGLTSTTPQLPGAASISRILRERFPKIRQIFGGAHATLVYASLKKNEIRAKKNWNIIEDLFDTIVVGDGEYSILEAIKETSSAVIDASNISSPLFLTISQLNESLYPARELIDLNSYHYYINEKRATSLIGQLGCPFLCGFCSGRNSLPFRRVRTRSADSIINEIMYIHSVYGYTGFMFYDDELNLNDKLAIELMKRLIDLRNKGHDFRYRGCIKAQLLTDEQAKYMSEAGFYEILVGFESGNDRILTNINKRSTVADNERCVGYLKKHGIKTKFLMSIGHPGESNSTCQNTYDWLLAMKPDYFDVTIITAQPGSPYYDQSVLIDKRWTYKCPNGDALYTVDIDYSVIVDYYKGVVGKYKSYVSTDFLSSEELIGWRDYIETSVRSKLKLPFPSIIERDYDKSIGQ